MFRRCLPWRIQTFPTNGKIHASRWRCVYYNFYFHSLLYLIQNEKYTVSHLLTKLWSMWDSTIKVPTHCPCIVQYITFISSVEYCRDFYTSQISCDMRLLVPYVYKLSYAWTLLVLICHPVNLNWIKCSSNFSSWLN